MPRRRARPKPLVPRAPQVKWVNAPPPGGWWPDARAAADDTTIYYNRDADRRDKQHELGHLFDEQVLSDSERVRLSRIMRVKGDWVQDHYDEKGNPTGQVSPTEAFADWYGNARMGQGPGFKQRTKYGPAERWDPGYGVNPRGPRAYRRFLKIVNRSYARYEREQALKNLLG
jgi:hypothetical protein